MVPPTPNNDRGRLDLGGCGCRSCPPADLGAFKRPLPRARRARRSLGQAADPQREGIDIDWGFHAKNAGMGAIAGTLIAVPTLFATRAPKMALGVGVGALSGAAVGVVVPLVLG